MFILKKAQIAHRFVRVECHVIGERRTRAVANVQRATGVFGLPRAVRERQVQTCANIPYYV